MGFSNHISDEDRDHLYAAGAAARADSPSRSVQLPEHIRFLEQQRRSTIADFHAHQAGHQGGLAATIPCFMDSQGICHGVGEQIAKQADEAIEAHQAALGRYYSDYFHADQ